MISKRWGAAIFAVPLISSLLWSGLPAQANEALATVTGVENVVQFRLSTAQAWNLAVPGTPINTGNTVQTGPRSKAELTYQDGTVVRLSSTSTLVIMDQERRVLKLLLGKLWAKVAKGSRGMRVHTASAVASITGTQFILEVLPDQSTHLTVLEGTVLMFPLRGAPGPSAGGPDQGSQPSQTQPGESVSVPGTGSEPPPGSSGPDNPPVSHHTPADREQPGPPGPGAPPPGDRPGGPPSSTVAGGPPPGPGPSKSLDMSISFRQGGGPGEDIPVQPIRVSAGQALIARPEAPLPTAFSINPDVVKFQEAPLSSAPLANSIRPHFKHLDTDRGPGLPQMPPAAGPPGIPGQPQPIPGNPGNPPPPGVDITKSQLQNQRIDPKDLKGSPVTGTIEILIK